MGVELLGQGMSGMALESKYDDLRGLGFRTLARAPWHEANRWRLLPTTSIWQLGNDSNEA